MLSTQKTFHHVFQQTGNVIVKIIPGQAAAEGDGTGRKNGTTRGRLKIGHVGPDQLLVRDAGPVGNMRELLFRHQDKRVVVVFRRCHDHGVLGRSQVAVVAIQFKARRTPTAETKITDGPL